MQHQQVVKSATAKLRRISLMATTSIKATATTSFKAMATTSMRTIKPVSLFVQRPVLAPRRSIVLHTAIMEQAATRVLEYRQLLSKGSLHKTEHEQIRNANDSTSEMSTKSVMIFFVRRTMHMYIPTLRSVWAFGPSEPLCDLASLY